jgi:hypothetical protein
LGLFLRTLPSPFRNLRNLSSVNRAGWPRFQPATPARLLTLEECVDQPRDSCALPSSQWLGIFVHHRTQGQMILGPRHLYRTRRTWPLLSQNPLDPASNGELGDPPGLEPIHCETHQFRVSRNQFNPKSPQQMELTVQS